MRCLKRYIAREAFRLMTAEQPALPSAASLRARRAASGLTQAQVARGLGVSAAKVHRIESGKTFDCSLVMAYDELLSAVENPS